MEVRSETPCRKDFDFTVPAAAIAREADRTARDFALSVNIPGFRRGKAPVSMLKSRFANEINRELKRRIVYAAFDKVSEDKDLDMVSCGLEKEPERYLEIRGISENKLEEIRQSYLESRGMRG